LQMSGGFDVQQLVEESTIEFLAELRECFNRQVKVFNGYSEGGSRFTEVKLYAIAQSAADFMLFRNQVKLIIANTAHGVLQLAFNQHAQAHGGGFIQPQAANASPNGANSGAAASAVPAGAELLAQVGPFRDIFWTFQGERVTAPQVAKFYFGEFVRSTREVRRSKAGNQVLLDQIKALLQEKGLDL
jgi:hypothetical protein